MKNLILFCLLFSIGVVADLKAQLPNSYVVSVGYPVGFDSWVNYGFSLALGKYYETAGYGGLEGQISYVYANVDTYTIPIFFNPSTSTKKIVQNHSLSLTGGIRLYLTKRKRKTQLYTNMLLGVYALESERNNQFFFKKSGPDEIGFGFVMGLFLELKNGVIIGISGEKPDYLIGRVGYNF